MMLPQMQVRSATSAFDAPTARVIMLVTQAEDKPVNNVRKEKGDMMTYGLNDEQVRASREKHGDNSMTEQPTESFWSKLIGNFGDPMIRILCVALVINVVFAFMGQTKWYESAGIAMAVLLATLVSTFSEYRNETAFQRLQKEASLIKCKVFRNREIIEIPINDIVVDDYILLQVGDKIPADGILVEGTVQVDQSVLNGEAKETTKNVMPNDYIDTETAMDFLNQYKVFRGSVVCSGNAVMCVTTVGDKSVYGQIACELQSDDERDTPLKLKLGKLANQISKFGYIGGIAIAVAFLFQRIVIHNGFNIAQISSYCANWMTVVNDVVEAVMLAVIIIVMAVPEGLPLMIAIVSAQNMGKMLKDHVLVRKIAGIETAGSLNILFSDKTGTITKGQLEAVVFVDGRGREYRNYNEVVGELGQLLSLSIRHNTSAVLTGEGEYLRVVGGNATERAILSFVAGNQEIANVSVTESIPFCSQNKYSAAHIDGDYSLSLVKGAPEKILERCKFCYDENGRKQPLLPNNPAVNAKIDDMAGRAIRVLALATCDAEICNGELPDGAWTLVGVIGIRDEVRPESINAIAQVQSAGVQVVMITGDRKDTAIAIAKEAGLLKSDRDIVLTSDELAQLSDDALMEKLPAVRVVARALPSDKSRFVRVAQEMNLVVGMTGDGVNDSPALKRADVGFAMGGGTEVAKEASEIVIMDDNFSSIERAILYGRTIFNSIRKFIIFQLTINVAAVLISFVSPLLGIENPLSITQILWVNLVMDTLAALAFGGEPALQRYMLEKPKKRDEHIVSGTMWSSILTGCLWTFALSLAFILLPAVSGFFRADAGNKYLLTGYFAFFILTSVFNAFNARTEGLKLWDHLGKNKGFLRVMGLIVAVQIVMTYCGGVILRCYGLNATEWIFVLAAAITIIPIDLIRKLFVGRSRQSCNDCCLNEQKEELIMAVSLSKGQKVDLTKGNPSLSKLVVGLGWDTNKYDGGAAFDLDAAAFLLGADGKAPSDADFVFYGNLSHVSGGVEHMGDNLTGEGDGDDEQIKVNLSAIPTSIQKIAFTVTIYEAEARRQNFGQVSNAFIRIVDDASNAELIRYDLGEDFSVETAVVVGELYRNSGEWKFNAIGSGFQGGLKALCQNFGIHV